MSKSRENLNILLFKESLEISPLIKFLPREGPYNFFTISSRKDLKQSLKNNRIQAVIIQSSPDLKDTISLIRDCKAYDPLIEIIVVGSPTESEERIRFLKSGASDYLNYPLKPEAFQVSLIKIADKYSLRRETFRLEKKLEKKYSFCGIIGKSPYMLEIFALIDKLANHFSSILITGETGTGKEMVARAIRSLSQTPNSQLVICDCTSIPDNLFESELFGYKKGAFTGAVSDKKGLFEEADKGIIFLDEIGEVPLPIQGKLLRVLEHGQFRPLGSIKTKQVDVKFIAATSHNLRDSIKNGTFREDLFHRLNKVEIHLPPLRERTEDIPLLVRHYLEIYNKSLQKKIKGVSRGVQKLFQRYEWPGNVRELVNILERACLLAEKDFIDLADLPDYLQNYLPPPSKFSSFSNENLASLEEMEKEYIGYLLKKTKNNIKKTADILNVSRTTLYNKIKKYNLTN